MSDVKCPQCYGTGYMTVLQFEYFDTDCDRCAQTGTIPAAWAKDPRTDYRKKVAAASSDGEERDTESRINGGGA